MTLEEIRILLHCVRLYSELEGVADDERWRIRCDSTYRPSWVAGPGATPEEIAQLEARIGKRLPASYRNVLEVANGAPYLSPLQGRLLPTTEVDWYRSKHPDLVDAWVNAVQPGGMDVANDEYFVYGPHQNPGKIRDRYLYSALQVSEHTGTVLLLVPEVIFDGDEWEAWCFGKSMPGARRFHSFTEMLLWLAWTDCVL